MFTLDSENELVEFGERVQSVIEAADKEDLTWGIFLFSPERWVEHVNRELFALSGRIVRLRRDAERFCLDYVSQAEQAEEPYAGLSMMAGLLLHDPHLVVKGVSRIHRHEVEMKRLAKSRRVFAACQTVLESYDLCRTAKGDGIVFVFAGWHVMTSQYGSAKASSASIRLDDRVELK
jgi:hypothetical protein